MERRFPYYRQVRGDGNCFYRAFIYAYLELLVLKGSKSLAAFIDEYRIDSPSQTHGAHRDHLLGI